MKRDEIMQSIQDIDEKFIIEADKEYIVMNKNTPKRWVAVASIIAVPVITATAYQAGFLADVVDIFSTKHGEQPHQIEYIQEVARSNGASVTVNGTTVRVDAIMGDNNQADVVYNISNDGVTLKLPEDSIDPETGYSISYNWYYTAELYHVESSLVLGWYMQGGGLSANYEENDDGTLKLTQSISYGKNPKGETVRVAFNGIGYNKFIFDGDEFITSEYIPVIEDEINLEYVLDYGESEQYVQINTGDTSTQIDNSAFTHNGKDVVLTTLFVSPQSLKLEFECPEPDVEYSGYIEGETQEEQLQRVYEYLDKRSGDAIEFIESIPFYFTNTDGTTTDIFENYKVGRSMRWDPDYDGLSEGMMLVTVGIDFAELILLDDIVSVTFGECTTSIGEVSSQSNDATFKHQDKDIIFKTISVSPQSVRVEFDFTKFGDDYLSKLIDEQITPTQGEGDIELDITEEDIRLMQEENEAQMDFLKSIPLYFTKTDNSTIDLYDYWDIGCGMQLSSGDYDEFNTLSDDMMACSVDIVFGEVMSLDDIVSVTFGEYVTNL